MSINNTKGLLMTLKLAIDNDGGWFWHEDLENIEALEVTLLKSFWIEEPNFEHLAYEVLKFLEIIDDLHHIETETIQFRANIWSDEDEFLQNGGDEMFDSFSEYLEYHKIGTFEDLKEILVKELFGYHYTHFKGEK